MTLDQRDEGKPPDRRRLIPRTDHVLEDDRLAAARVRLGPDAVRRAVHAAQERARAGHIPPESVADAAVAALPSKLWTLRKVINATGVVLHTNLGRAPLSRAAVDALVDASGYTDVEFDALTGERGRRGAGMLEALLSRVPDAEDGHVVNNGAAALALAVAAFASGREVVISRGEMVEIGDGFRIPELVAAAGGRLKEIGTTNRTHISDYAQAIGGATGFVLKVHTSNFRVEGFTASVPINELAGLDVTVVADIGSGLLAHDPLLPSEPDVGSWLRDGADLVTASGDKLLGGPQAGLLLGKHHLVHKVRRHPLARAMRVDKLTIAALEATLRAPSSPTRDAIHASDELLQERASTLADTLVARGVDAAPIPSTGRVGGGSAPGLALGGWAVQVPEQLATPLRTGDPPIIGRIEKGVLILDLRCVDADDDREIVRAVETALSSRASSDSPACT
ncbi:MAG: L-seryl-tRNA(Sec) selenium transferase [Acidimicrobiales bacterium]